MTKVPITSAVSAFIAVCVMLYIVGCNEVPLTEPTIPEAPAPPITAPEGSTDPAETAEAAIGKSIQEAFPGFEIVRLPASKDILARSITGTTFLIRVRGDGEIYYALKVLDHYFGSDRERTPINHF